MLFLANNTETEFLKGSYDFLFWSINWKLIH
jgi:hypothetical protein